MIAWPIADHNTGGRAETRTQTENGMKPRHGRLAERLFNPSRPPIHADIHRPMRRAKSE